MAGATMARASGGQVQASVDTIERKEICNSQRLKRAICFAAFLLQLGQEPTWSGLLCSTGRDRTEQEGCVLPTARWQHSALAHETGDRGSESGSQGHRRRMRRTVSSVAYRLLQSHVSIRDGRRQMKGGKRRDGDRDHGKETEQSQTIQLGFNHDTGRRSQSSRWGR